jgi:hypothetical protein
MIKIWSTEKLELVRTISTNGIGKVVVVMGGAVVVVWLWWVVVGCGELWWAVHLSAGGVRGSRSAIQSIYCLTVVGQMLLAGNYRGGLCGWLSLTVSQAVLRT